MKVTRTSQLSGKEHTIEMDVTLEQMIRFDNRIKTGEYVQTIFPDLSKELREFILTGITPKEWDETFK